MSRLVNSTGKTKSGAPLVRRTSRPKRPSIDLTTRFTSFQSNPSFEESMLRRFKSSAHRRLGELRTSGLRARLRTQVRELDARGISIISNNCVAGILYEMAGLPKRSPTAGIYFSDLAYARFLDDLAKSRTEFWTELEPTDLVFNENQHCWALPVEPGGQLVF